mgnify:FL=1
MCGEHLDAGSEQKPCPGSSPHVRGALLRLLIAATIGGIIPACAGSTRRACRRCWPNRDHPRMCGEHDGADGVSSPPWGSSPHVRGAPLALNCVAFSGGIIPACAGSTSSSRGPGWRRRDHPRMCGEHLVIAGLRPSRSGSSPHVRGALLNAEKYGLARGIIPACAGSTHGTG